MPPKKTQPRRRRVDLILQPVVTAELQILYNIWRDAEVANDLVRTGSASQRKEINKMLSLFKRKLGVCLKCKKRKIQVSSDQIQSKNGH